MSATSTAAFAVIAGVVALTGLFVSANAADSTMAWVGMAFAAWGVAFVFFLIKTWYDAAERR